MTSDLIARAQAGDEKAFRQLVDRHQYELRVHCYRILGSVEDAEDQVQETFLAAWHGITGFEARASVRAGLFKIATNRCLDALRAARRRPAVPAAPPAGLPEPTCSSEVIWLQPYPDIMLEELPEPAPGPEARYEAREAISVAFVSALQLLPPRQRAVLVLRDVLGFRSREVATMLGSSEDSVSSALRHARANLHRRLPSPADPPPVPGSAAEREVVERLTRAYETGDVDVACGLVKRFGPVVALDGIDLAVQAGTVLGLLGPNGAGKTTAVRILTTILAPDAGQASVLGRDVVRQAEDVRAVIGLAGQYAAVDENLTGRENLRLIGQLTHQRRPATASRAEELLGRFGLTSDAARPVRTYSGGMRRRLDLAAALVHRPPVLFLDEPTTGLDPGGRSDMWTLIGELVADGTTVLLTTQYLEEADRLANHIVVIDCGQIIAEGTPVELKASLGSTVVEIRVADPADAQRAAERLLRIAPAGVLDGSRTLAVKVRDKGPAVQEVIRLLDADAIVSESLAIREPTLDDVFLQLTGHRADLAPDQPAPHRRPPTAASI